MQTPEFQIFAPQVPPHAKMPPGGRPPPLPAATVCNTFTILLLPALKLFAFVAYVVFSCPHISCVCIIFWKPDITITTVRTSLIAEMSTGIRRLLSRSSYLHRQY